MSGMQEKERERNIGAAPTDVKVPGVASLPFKTVVSTSLPMLVIN